MKKYWLCFLLMIALLPLSTAVCEIGTRYIMPLQTHDSRVKLRDEPSKGGKILGQYYSGTQVTVWEEANGWARVSIGGKKGYMMNEFLSPDSLSPTMGRVLPANGAKDAAMLDEQGNEIARLEKNQRIQVLGTAGEKLLHIAIWQGEEQKFGYLSSELVAWTENLGRAVVDSGNSARSIRLREEPSEKAATLCQLYSGVSVHLLFDHHTAGDGWTRVRVGDEVGYMMDEYLDFSSDGSQKYRPMYAKLNVPQAIVTGCLHGTVYQSDPLFILGTAGSVKTPLYLCLAGSWDETGTQYDVFTCYLQKQYVQLPASGKVQSVSTAGAIKKPTCLYTRDPEGRFIPMSTETYPTGTSLMVVYAADAVGNPIVDEPFSGYLTQDTAWVYAEVTLPGQKNASISGYLPAEAVECEEGLRLPGGFTNG